MPFSTVDTAPSSFPSGWLPAIVSSTGSVTVRSDLLAFVDSGEAVRTAARAPAS